jgi:hypothetical protein
MTGYHDYLILLTPPESIVKTVAQLKESSFKMIGEYESHHSKAHITVQPWPRKRPVWVEPLLPKLERDLQTLPPLVMDLNGFDFFDQQEFQTIYAKLSSTPATKLWFKLLRKFFNTPPFEPNIGIAVNIANADFKKLWPEFKNKEWHERFKVEQLTILRRETIGYNKTFKVFKEIPFNKKLDFFDFTSAKLKQPALAINKVNDKQFSLF